MKLSLEQKGDIEVQILKRVRAHPGISRIALARQLRIAASTVGNYAGRLITEGFLVESKKGDYEMGRPPTSLQLNPDGGQFIGVDFEARNIMAMAVDFSDQPLKQAHKEIQKSDSVPEILRKIKEAIIEVLPKNHSRLLAIGVGVPGLVDPAKGVALQYKYIKHWRHVSLAAPLAKKFGVPVYLENNIRSMTLAELWFGQGRGLADFLCIGIRSGIGAGLVAGGQLQRGADYRAGEIGRWRCPWPSLSTARLLAGQRPLTADIELQEAASVRAILSAWERTRSGVRKGRPPRLTFTDLVRAAQAGDTLTIQLIKTVAVLLGDVVAKLVLALNSSRVILTGPLTLLGETLLEPLRVRTAAILRAAEAGVPIIISSSMGEYSGALGAAALAVHEWKPAF